MLRQTSGVMCSDGWTCEMMIRHGLTNYRGHRLVVLAHLNYLPS
jgi:hypothetical protein